MFDEFATIFLALLVETTPFLLGGVVLAVVAGPWLQRSLAVAASRTPGLGLIAGAGAGLALPMCDCGSRPLAQRMALAGQTHFAIAFLVAAPIVNPIVIVTTWLAFRDASLVVLRLGLAVLVAIVTALVIARLSGDVARQLVPSTDHAELDAAPWHRRLPAEVLSDFVGLFAWLVLGSALAAALQVFVDNSVFTDRAGLVVPILMMMALGFVLSICSSVDALVVAGFAGSLGTGPLLGFLVFGPIVNLKSMPLYGRLFSVATVGLLVLLSAELVFVAATVVELRGW
jgi:uncharacterized membrane protein YraQ (UPF0718 family)